ncbi:MAG: PG0541 family transporter-associated protein [Deltaproteobacteria bacterium]
MKAFFIFYDQELLPEVEFLLRSSKVENFSRFTAVQGKGDSGLKEGSAVGPGLNHALWIVLEDQISQKFLSELKEFKKDKLKQKGIKIFMFPIEASL